MKPFDNFNCRISSFYWRIIPYGDEPKTAWTCWHMFGPYNSNIFKIGMKSSCLSGCCIKLYSCENEVIE